MTADQRVISTKLANTFHSEVIKWRQYAAKVWSLIIIVFLVLLNNVLTKNSEKSGFDLFCETLFFMSIILTIFWILFTFHDKQFKGLSSQTTFFILAFCCFSNLVNNFRFLTNQSYLLKWPIVKQSKFFRFKSRCYRIAIETIRDGIFQLIAWNSFYTIMYFFISPFNASLLSFFNLKYWLICLNVSFIVNFANSISWCLYEIYLTEIYNFPIQTKDTSQLTLPIAISLDSYPYIQMLGLIDFVDLSVYSKNKRKQLLSLNYPSGLPTNWNLIYNETLDLIRKFMDIFDFDDMLHGGKDCDSFEKTPEISLKAIRRNIASMYESSYIEKTSSSYGPKKKSKDFCLMEAILQKLKKSKLFLKFYNENEDYKTQQLFVDSQLIINALKGLSNMVMVSYTEDQYGIVQQALPAILNSFVQLQRILENFNPMSSRLNISFKLLQREDAGYTDLIIQKLIFTLNESMHKIVTTFDTSLESLSLNPDTRKKLKQYYLNK